MCVLTSFLNVNMNVQLCTQGRSAHGYELTAERLFRLHGNRGRQHSTEGRAGVRLRLFTFQGQNLTFNFSATCCGHLRSSESCHSYRFGYLVSNKLIFCNLKLLPTPPSGVTCERKRRLSGLNETLYCSAICLLSCFVKPCGITYKLNPRC